MDFETLVLSRAELKNLKLISKGPVANNEEWAHRLNELLDLGFVEVQMYLDESKNLASVLSISEMGKRYLQYLNRRKSETRFANTMSVLAFLVSVIALIVSIISPLLSNKEIYGAILGEQNQQSLSISHVAENPDASAEEDDEEDEV